jgi:ATP-dependent RNA helicase DeaD
VEWNDAPKPRQKKPKPGAKPVGKPGGKPKFKRPEAPSDGPRTAGVDDWKPRKPRTKARAADGAEAPTRRGPPPPQGKPSSKKNRARAQALAEAKGGPGAKPRKPRAKKAKKLKPDA